jgi:HAD superfamily hydrolase (TIGR01509 family)
LKNDKASTYSVWGTKFMMHELVIFDCDGVLVDTEMIANNHIAEVLSQYGPTITGEESRKLFQGKTLEDVCETFASTHNLPHDAELPKLMRRTIEDAMSSGIEPIPGAVELVHQLIDQDIALCVASSGSIPKMHKTLGQVGLLDQLEHLLFSAQNVGRGKPYPDVFLAAAKAMNVDCRNAVIIEDSLSGVQAGIAAGARVLGYAGDAFTDAAELAGAGAEVFTDMADVRGLIGLK